MSEEEILKIDFYDLCGVGSIWMTDQDKIDWWRKYIENKKQSYETLPQKKNLAN